MHLPSVYKAFQRYATLQTHKISVLPIVILMPHSACNCRCVMCDIWRDNKNLKQLSEDDVKGLLLSLKKFGVKKVVMSGGEALLSPLFFRFCEILQKEKIKVSLLTTGLSIKKNAQLLLHWVNDIIISLDGDQSLHDTIRNVPGAFDRISEGVQYLKSINPAYKITARTVIHRINYKSWHLIIVAARKMGVDQISFLPADVSSHAFNREVLWNESKQHEIMLQKEELPELQEMINRIIENYGEEFGNRFIAESPLKVQKIYEYYAALYRLNPFPYKQCNAPWVSTVIEADGTVRPCFFHNALGNIHENSLDEILNSKEAIHFRKTLDIATDNTCMKCVCYLNLPPAMNPVSI